MKQIALTLLLLSACVSPAASDVQPDSGAEVYPPPHPYLASQILCDRLATAKVFHREHLLDDVATCRATLEPVMLDWQARAE